MTAAKFRSLALGLPEATESAHIGHPDFRVGGRIFATLTADERLAMVKLQPAEQAAFIRDEPNVFQAASGAWGRRGCTMVRLSRVKAATIRHALMAAWRNTAPKRLLEE
jgi:hypothetical protein